MSSSPETSSPLPPALPGTAFEVDDRHGGRVQVYGSGPLDDAGASPTLLIHSVNAAASAFEVRPLYERLSASRPTYALDLPGFGHSDRSERDYAPRLMTDAVHAVTALLRERHGGAVDALAVSLSCEFLARAACEDSESYRSLAFVSPTGFGGNRRLDGPTESTKGSPTMRAILGWSLWDDALYRQLTRPKVIRYFLERTWGSKDIDEDLWAYDVKTARQPGAKNAPLAFLSGYLFSADVSRLYEALHQPVWMSHGIRGDFVDYRGADALLSRSQWERTVYETGALPHFEVPERFVADYVQFLQRVAEA
jgi:pimeloyl-ACP methyl ester carboxylesterase